MRKRNLRPVILAVLAAGGVLGTALPAWADHTGFSKAEYEVWENAAYVDLNVEGSFCCPPPSGQIDYATSNLTAIAGADYRQTSGTLTFPAEYTIRVPIQNDEAIEGEEQFQVTLSNYRGTMINRGRTSAVVRILDDDPKPPAGSSSPGRSSGQTAGSSGGSSARPPSPQSAASRAADADNQSAGVTTPIPGSPDDQDDVALPDETDAQDHPAEPLGRQAEQGRSDRSSLVLAALAVLLVVAGASFGILRRNSR